MIWNIKTVAYEIMAGEIKQDPELKSVSNSNVEWECFW